MGSARPFPRLLCLMVLVINVHMVVGSQDDQCRFVFQDNVVLDVEASEGNGAEVVDDIHVDNKITCAEKCCSAEGSWCTLAVFHSQAAADEINCFLIKCIPDGSSEDKCVKRHMKHSGFVSAEVTHHIIHTNPAAKHPTTQPAIKTTTRPTTRAPPTTISTTKTTTTTATTTTKTTSRAITTTKATTQPQKVDTTTTPSSEWTSPAGEQLANQTSANNGSQPMGTAQSGEGPDGQYDETHGHVPKQTVTQTGILIVTLCFGIIFMLVMLVVMGKRWCEGYRKRKYSKVNYLINGMYS